VGEARTRPLTVSDMTQVTSYHDIGAVLNSLDANQGLHSSSYTADAYGPGPVDSFTSDAILSLHGSEHFERRRLESRLFSKDARARMEFEILLPVLRRQLQDHLARSESGEADLMPFSRLILARLSGAIVGLLPVDDLETAEHLRVVSEQIMNAVASPWVSGDRDAIVQTGLKAQRAFAEDFYAPALGAVEAGAPDPTRGVISLLACNPGAVGSAEVMFHEATLFLIASSSTTSNALPHTIWELERWLERHPEARPELDSFEFCRQAASEALRLHPPNPGLLRYMTAPLTLPSGLRLDEGEFVFLDIRRSGRDPSIYGENAGEFDPRRKVAKGIWPFGFTFGGGSHMCIGRTLSIGDAGASADPRAPQGVLTRLLHELYRWGVRLDPGRPPRFRPDTARDDYDVFPVRFERRAVAA
jgi:cytochrome P450